MALPNDRDRKESKPRSQAPFEDAAEGVSAGLRIVAASQALRREAIEMRLRIWIDRLGEQRVDIDRWLAFALDAAISVESAERGTLQFLDEARQALVIRVQRGFEQPFLDFFGDVRVDASCSCGLVLRDNKPVVVKDVSKSPVFANAELAAMMNAGIEGVKSVPITANGDLLGVLSVHYLPLFGRMDGDVSRLQRLAGLISTRLARLSAA